MARPTGRPVREELITEAIELAKAAGVAAVSYGTLAERLGIRAASIHHHFPKREDLLVAIMKRYRFRFAERLQRIETTPADAALIAYGGLFAEATSDQRLCLCGAATAEWYSTGADIRYEVSGFFADQLSWVTSVISGAVSRGEFRSDLEAKAEASLLLAALEGAILLDRAGATTAFVSEVTGRLVDHMTKGRGGETGGPRSSPGNGSANLR